MSFKSKLSAVNQCLILFSSGSINYSEAKWIPVNYLSRLISILANLILLYESHKWTVNSKKVTIEPISIVLIVCMDVRFMAPMISVLWRFHTDKHLSRTLSKLENIYDALLNMNVVTSVKKQTLWIIIFGIFFDYFMYVVLFVKILTTVHYKKIPLINKVVIFYSITSQRFSCYEFYGLMIFIQWTVFKINKEMCKTSNPVVDLIKMYTMVVDCLQNMNKNILGLSVLMNNLIFNIAFAIFAFYTEIIFPSHTTNLDFYFNIMFVCMKLYDIFLLHFLAHITEKEINKTSNLMNQRYIIETNPRLRRKIQFFILRRSHEKFNFKLCGFYLVNFRQLLILLSKSMAFLIIQIQLKLK